MRTFSDLQPAARHYVSAVSFVGMAAVVASLGALYRDPIAPEWLGLAALTILTGSFTIKVPSVTARLTVSETFVFASVLLFGTSAGTLTVVLETLVIALWLKREKRSLYRVVFNVAASALSIWLAASAFFALAGVEPLWNHPSSLSTLFGPLAVLTTVFFLSNSWLVAIALGLEKSASPLGIWSKNFIWVSVNYFSGASVAAVIVTYTNTLNGRALFGTLVIIMPLLLVSYLTFRTAMARVEDSNQHLVQVNRLYLSTIETLAMAVDAKDQVTHGHIRRVQAHATNLARAIGIKDENLLKAIEAAALLHDMGKLAVPEYILNKPGKLTDVEFEKMKLHASVGADILSAIDFPYPVVPIVRHHHENWDGTGYPAGLRQTEIPIGARILSVVDCFDALTSDRPYRPRLRDVEAIEILLERRGSMYDPLIVDAFLKIHSDSPIGFPRNGPPSDVLNTIADARRPRSNVDTSTTRTNAASADEMLAVYALSRALPGHVNISDAGDVIAKHLQLLIPSSLCAFYLYDSAASELEARHVVGEGADAVRGLRIPLGQRLSGWVAANRQTILNSDPVLDLGDVAKLPPQLRSCLSAPLLSDSQLIGVLSLYSTTVNAFTEDQRRVIEILGRQISYILRRAIDFEPSATRDQLTGLPNLEQLKALLLDSARHDASTHSLLHIDVHDLKQINTAHGRDAGDAVLRHVVQHVRAALRVSDILFRNESDEFTIFLGGTDKATAEGIATRIGERIRVNPVSIGHSDTINIDTSVVVATTFQQIVDQLAGEVE